ncbi:ATP-NAD kinase family protein [Xylanimonas ulmi]|uniref:Putative polyphosphate/ATP-dependent NAD kinase n=1 Tax=Xylanimonas ulmi TaxID=228973 RepID=A0A4Q7M271_9MICO|nr:NAD(+)/NADH kinase [Xylanibacterium ulmi]RZS61965.1 putative polyphosphate/ATP-dependent NAD kinase [Xylanibacterium ulmi]
MTAITDEVTVGVVANPASGRDIRRLVAAASVFPTAEKANMVRRMLAAFAAVGVGHAMLNTDKTGISASVLRAAHTRRPGHDPDWPRLTFCDEDRRRGTAQDTVDAVRRMVAAGARVIVCLGGDGTARVAADACGDVPMLALSTGTNNAFPQMREATVAGLAAGLVAVGAVDPATTVRRAGALEVRTPGRRELALVDVCVSSAQHVGSRALWRPDDLLTLVCSFAEPDGVGLSSVAGLLCPSPREDPDGVVLDLAPPERARYVVRASIAPGLVVPVGVDAFRPLRPGETLTLPRSNGVIAVDGEREIELWGGRPATVALVRDGPRCVDVAAVMREAARTGVLSIRQTTPTNWRTS